MAALSGQAQAELVKAAVIGLAVIGAAWYIQRKTGQIGDSIASTWSDITGAVSSAADTAQQAGSNALDLVTLPGMDMAAPAPFLVPTIIINSLPAGSFNPASDQNLVNQGVNSLGRQISGQQDWTLGGWIYDITH